MKIARKVEKLTSTQDFEEQFVWSLLEKRFSFIAFLTAHYWFAIINWLHLVGQIFVTSGLCRKI